MGRSVFSSRPLSADLSAERRISSCSTPITTGGRDLSCQTYLAVLQHDSTRGTYLKDGVQRISITELFEASIPLLELQRGRLVDFEISLSFHT